MTPVLVPYRGDGAWRDRCWSYVEAWWRRIGPIHIGDVPGRFERAAARNAAAHAAGDWRVAVFADADTILADVAPVHAAIDLALRESVVVLPHDTYIGLTAGGTVRLMERGTYGEQIKVRKTGAPLGVIVVPRSAWEVIGGFDERFTGWGGEDVAFRIAASTLVGLRRLPGTLVHLWHPIDPSKGAYIKSRGGRLRQAYRVAEGDAAAMAALVGGAR